MIGNRLGEIVNTPRGAVGSRRPKCVRKTWLEHCTVRRVGVGYSQVASKIESPGKSESDLRSCFGKAIFAF
jgi:hypothetical protein